MSAATPARHTPMSPEQEIELFEKMQALKSKADPGGGESGGGRRTSAARELENLRTRLLNTHACWLNKIAGNYQTPDMPAEDLFQEACIGLHHAMERFDHRRGFRFSTFAQPYVAGRVKRALSGQSRLIRIPEYQLNVARHLKETIRQLSAELGREPSEHEISVETGLSLKRVREYRELDQAVVSIDAPLDADNGSTMGDFIADDSALDPSERAHLSMSHVDMVAAMSRLPERHLEILRLSFGLNGGEPRTLAEIGSMFGLTRERIRQIKEEAESMLRKFMTPGPKAAAPVKTTARKPAAPSVSPVPAGGKRQHQIVMRGLNNGANHHIWKNHGIWYCNFKAITESGSTKRVRTSLKTRDVEMARRERDRIFDDLLGPGWKTQTRPAA